MNFSPRREKTMCLPYSIEFKSIKLKGKQSQKSPYTIRHASHRLVVVDPELKGGKKSYHGVNETKHRDLARSRKLKASVSSSLLVFLILICEVPCAALQTQFQGVFWSSYGALASQEYLLICCLPLSSYPSSPSVHLLSIFFGGLDFYLRFPRALTLTPPP